MERQTHEPYSIFDLMNGKVTENEATEVTRLLWFRDDVFTEGLDLFFSKVFKGELIHADYFVAWVQAALKHDRRAVQVLAAFKSQCPQAVDWIAVLEAHRGSWDKTPTPEADEHLRTHPDPFFRAMELKKRAMELIKKRDETLREEGIDHQADLDAITGLLEEALATFKQYSLFEAGRVCREFSTYQTDIAKQRKYNEEAWEYFKACRNSYYAFRAFDAMRKNAETELVIRKALAERNRPKILGDLFDAIEFAKDEGELAEAIFRCVTSGEFLCLAYARVLKVNVNAKPILLKGSDSKRPPENLTTVDLGYGLRLEIDETTNKKALNMVLQGVKRDVERFFRTRQTDVSLMPISFDANHPSVPPLLFYDPKWKPVIDEMEYLARLPMEQPITILGPSGIGKTRFARIIHHRGETRQGTFIEYDASRMNDPNDARGQYDLFGAPLGSYTGQTKDQKGMIQHARGGSLFMDEFGEVDLRYQAKLLKVVEERSYSRIGEEHISHPADCRFIFATLKNLEQMKAKGTFRPDLYFRLKLNMIWLPGLNETPGQIVPLANVFARKVNLNYTLDGEAEEFLTEIYYDGNVRLLRDYIERAARLLKPGDFLIRRDHVQIANPEIQLLERRTSVPRPTAETPPPPKTSRPADVATIHPGTDPADPSRSFITVLRRLFDLFEGNFKDYFPNPSVRANISGLRYNRDSYPLPKTFTEIFAGLAANPATAGAEGKALLRQLATAYRQRFPVWEIPPGAEDTLSD